MKDPRPLASFRHDLPGALPSLVAQMMAKQPRDRMQSPGEVARLLDPLVRANPTARALVPVVARNALVPRPAEVVVINGRRVRRPVLEYFRDFRGWLQHLPPRRRKGSVIAARIGIAVALGLFVWFLARVLWSKPEEVFLSDLREKVVGVNSDIGFGKNGRMPNGVPISVAGRPASKGLGMPPGDRGTAMASYSLNKQFRRFKASVTLDDCNPECPTAVRFAVWVNGSVKWESDPVKKQSDRQEVSVDVTGADRLELTVSCPGNGRVGVTWSTYPVWLEPRLIK
jgi:hypothetical protein